MAPAPLFTPPRALARDLAWHNALVLWELRGDTLARGLFLDGLAQATALASRLLLTAV